MKIQTRRRLSLSKETLRNLSERELAAAVGGGTTTCCGTTSGCTYASECFCPTDSCGTISCHSNDTSCGC